MAAFPLGVKVSPMFKFALVGALILCCLAGSPVARAETSYHKLKKHLHKLEHGTGEVLQGTGEMLEEGLSGLELDVAVRITNLEDHKKEGDRHSERTESSVPKHSEKEARPKAK
jgi:hypothetical protein